MELKYIQALGFIFLYICAVMIFLIIRMFVIAFNNVDKRKKVNEFTFLKLLFLVLIFYYGLILFINSLN